MVDKMNYNITTHVNFLKSLAKKGFLIALHSNAMNYKNKLFQLELEINKFKKLLGFYPKTFSLHGKIIKYKNYNSIKNDFLINCKNIMKKYDLSGTHNISGIDYWVEDSLRGGEFSYLTDEFFSKKLSSKKVLGVLLHPDHWVESKIHKNHFSEINKTKKKELLKNEHFFLQYNLEND